MARTNYDLNRFFTSSGSGSPKEHVLALESDPELLLRIDEIQKLALIGDSLGISEVIDDVELMSPDHLAAFVLLGLKHISEAHSDPQLKSTVGFIHQCMVRPLFRVLGRGDTLDAARFAPETDLPAS